MISVLVLWWSDHIPHDVEHRTQGTKWCINTVNIDCTHTFYTVCTHSLFYKFDKLEFIFVHQ